MVVRKQCSRAIPRSRTDCQLGRRRASAGSYSGDLSRGSHPNRASAPYTAPVDATDGVVDAVLQVSFDPPSSSFDESKLRKNHSGCIAEPISPVFHLELWRRHFSTLELIEQRASPRILAGSDDTAHESATCR